MKKSSDSQSFDSIDRIFHALDAQSQGFIVKHDFLQALLDRGILPDDVRIRQTTQGLNELKNDQTIDAKLFRQLVRPHITLIEKALTGNLVIPDFKNFASFLTNLYNRTLQNEDGEVSTYIPALASLNSDDYAFSVCTVDGQRFHIGDYQQPYLARETAEPINYCLALSQGDEQSIHERVDRIPKEEGFDYLMLTKSGIPHNPLTGAGALLIGSLLSQEDVAGARLKNVMNLWESMAGGIRPVQSKAAFNQEQTVADRDRALAYFMQQHRLFAEGSKVDDELDFLWHCLALQTTTEAQSVMAATLANAGVCPTTEQEVLTPGVAKRCLAIMAIAGLQEQSSEFFYTVGLPATAGESGVMMIVVPDVMGIAIWSPRVDENGLSVKGTDFAHKLTQRFNFHAFDSAIKNVDKVDPRLKKNETKMQGVMAVTSAASIGDLDELHRLYSAGVDLNEGEYDKRTGLHLAASEGHLEAVQFFIDKNVDINPKDRWGGTPLADAKREGHIKVLELLKRHGGTEKA